MKLNHSLSRNRMALLRLDLLLRPLPQEKMSPKISSWLIEWPCTWNQRWRISKMLHILTWIKINFQWIDFLFENTSLVLVFVLTIQSIYKWDGMEHRLEPNSFRNDKMSFHFCFKKSRCFSKIYFLFSCDKLSTPLSLRSWCVQNDSKLKSIPIIFLIIDRNPNRF